MIPRPESYYSISKVFGENLGYMYSARFDMEFVSVRIGNFKRDRDLPTHPHQLSHGDAALVFERAVTQPGVKFEVVFRRFRQHMGTLRSGTWAAGYRLPPTG